MRKAFAKKNPKNKYFTHNNNQNSNDEFIFDTNNENEKGTPIWMKPETKEIKNISERFPKEILDYVNYIIPNTEKLDKCQETINLLTEIIKNKKPKWKVVLFGSYGQNIPTVFSDIDILIISDEYNKDFELKQMYNLMDILKEEGFCDQIKLVKAKVSILKATCINTGINVDISMNQENGYHAIGVVKKILKRYEILKPSIIILKILLKKFDLNESSSGGMPSFLLFHLLYFFYIQKYKINNIGDKNEFSPNEKIIINPDGNIIDKEEIKNEKLIDNDINIGEFILSFLKYFGFEFDYKNNGLSLNDDNFGKIFDKNERPDIKYNKYICVESIMEKGRDIGKSCFNYNKIVNLFKAVYDKINSEYQKNTCSILQSLGFPQLI